MWVMASLPNCPTQAHHDSGTMWKIVPPNQRVCQQYQDSKRSKRSAIPITIGLFCGCRRRQSSHDLRMTRSQKQRRKKEGAPGEMSAEEGEFSRVRSADRALDL